MKETRGRRGPRAPGESRVPPASRAPGTPADVAVSAAHPAAILATLVAAACVLVSVSFHLYDADAWEHLAFGKAIWATRAIPHTQIFCWSDYGVRLVNPSWGFSAVVWPFWAVGGTWGLFVWRWLTTLSAFTLLWLTARRLGARGFAGLLVMVVCSLVYRQRSQIRPETLAAVWFALGLWLLECSRAGGPDRRPWLAAVTLAWVNTHLSYYLAFLLVAVHLIDAHLGRSGWRRAQGGGASAGLARWWILAAVMLAVVFLNPYGWRGPVRPFQYALFWRHDPMLDGISELQPINWSLHRANGLPALVAGWPLLALWRWRRVGLDRVELLMCATFTVLGLSGGRFVATYGLAAAPYVARDVDAWVAALRRPRWSTGVWVRATLASLACIAAGWTEWTRFQGPLGVAFDMRHTPRQACAFMEAHGVRGRGFNHFYLGGTMLWHFWPQRDRLPFLDIHPEDAPPEIRAAYQRAVTSAEGWQDLDARYRFDYALLSRRYVDRYGLLDLLDADPAWAPVFIDDIAALYVRRVGPLAAVADSFGYRLVTGGRSRWPAQVTRAATDTALRAALIRELERQAGTAQSNFYGRQMLRAVSAAPGPGHLP